MTSRTFVVLSLLSGLVFAAPVAAGVSVPLSCSVAVVDGRFAVSWVDDDLDVDRYVVERQTFDQYWWRGRTDSETRTFDDGVAPTTSARVQYRVTSRDVSGDVVAQGACSVTDSAGLSCQVAETADGYEVSWSTTLSGTTVDAIVRRQIQSNLPFYWRARSTDSSFSDSASPTGVVTYQVILRIDQRIWAAASCTPPGPIFCPTNRGFDRPGVTASSVGAADQGRLWLPVDLGPGSRSLRSFDLPDGTLGALPDLQGRVFTSVRSVTTTPTGDVYFAGSEAGESSQTVYRLDPATNVVTSVAPEFATFQAIRMVVNVDVLVFNGSTPATGNELFAAPLAGGPARLLADVNPGPIGSDPEVGLADEGSGRVYFAAASAFGPRAGFRVSVATGDVELLQDPPISGDEGFLTGVLGPNGDVWFVQDRKGTRSFEIFRFSADDGSTTQISDLQGSGIPLALDFVDSDLISVDTAPGGAVIRRYEDGTGTGVVIAESDAAIGSINDALFLPNRTVILRARNGDDPDTTFLVDLQTGVVEQPRNLPIGLLSPPVLVAGNAVFARNNTLYVVSPDRC